MKTQHWALIAAMIAAISLQVAALHDWTEALKPQWVAGTLGIIATNLGALFTSKPRDTATATDRIDDAAGSKGRD